MALAVGELAKKATWDVQQKGRQEGGRTTSHVSWA